MYQRVGQSAYKANLDNTLLLAAYLDHPETAFKSIHVAGTNGKGSTSHMLASILQEAGYKVGLYTSPHLKDFRERIKINGAMIPKRKVSQFVQKHRSFFEAHQLSFFEMTVGLAFDYFRSEKVDIAVVEVGMGGRLDSTNIVTPEVSVITNIGWDHTQFLGDSLGQIAVEKAGIMKPNVPVVVGETQHETKTVFQKIAEERKCELFFADQIAESSYRSDLKGNYQKKNQQTVLITCRILQKLGWRISDSNLEKGIQSVIKNTGLMGRWQQLRAVPKTLCDTAHNKEGLEWTLQQIAEESFKDLHIVLGVVSDKDLNKILPLFPKSARYYFCAPKIPRAMNEDVLRQEAMAFELKGSSYNSVKKAYKAAVNAAHPDDFIYIGGSTFVVAEVL
jgi:dihydrofolate synthase/folylpolyglutamate synthase